MYEVVVDFIGKTELRVLATEEGRLFVGLGLVFFPPAEVGLNVVHGVGLLVYWSYRVLEMYNSVQCALLAF